MIKFLPYENEGFITFKAFESDAELGYCSFTLNGYVMKFTDVMCNDDIVTEGLARAAMNYGANYNVYIAEISKNLLCPAFIRLGFKGDDILKVEIPEALTSGCSCPH